MAKKKHHRRSEFPLSREQVRAIINAEIPSKRQRNPAILQRDRVLLKVLAHLALRASEAAELDWADLDLATGSATIDGKGDKVRVLRFGKRYPDLLADLRIMKGSKRRGPVFASLRPGKVQHITRQRIGQLVGAYADAAGIKSPNPGVKRVHPHMLRHSWAQNANADGLSIQYIRYWLGHDSSQTTIEQYLGVSQDSMEEALMQTLGDDV